MVQVAHPLVKPSVENVTFTGRTQAMEIVEIKAQASGYLKEVKFRDGARVEENDVLFVIDQEPYEANLQAAKAQLEEAKASLAKADADFKRAQSLIQKGAVSREEYDQRVAERIVAQASQQAAMAAVTSAEIDLGYTEIKAPIPGRLSLADVTEGNLVSANNPVTLTTLVRDDPIYVYFEVDEPALLQSRRELAQSGKVVRTGHVVDQEIQVNIGLTDEEGFPHQGTLDFIDNRVSASTGTIRCRAVFDNKDMLLIPGLFVRVQIPLGDPEPTMFVADRAINTDQGQKFVYVVNAEDKVEYRAVDLGPEQHGLRPVLDGLSKDDWVIVNGVQRARPGITVQTQEVNMADFVAGEQAAPPPATTTTSGDKP